MRNSTTFHLVRTMVSVRYVRQIKDGKRYRIGRPLFTLAASALDEIEIISLTTPVLEDLSRETGESSYFGVRMGDSVVVIAKTMEAGASQLAGRAGVVPLHGSARSSWRLCDRINSTGFSIAQNWPSSTSRSVRP